MTNDKTMQALVIEDFGRVAMGQMPYPVLRDDSLTIKVHYSGVSIGTEMLQGTGRHGTLKPPSFLATRPLARSWRSAAELPGFKG